MKLIVAVDKEWGIGYKGVLLARVRADLFNFRDLTSGKIVILGSNTLATFPVAERLKTERTSFFIPLPSISPKTLPSFILLTSFLKKSKNITQTTYSLSAEQVFINRCFPIAIQHT